MLLIFISYLSEVFIQTYILLHFNYNRDICVIYINYENVNYLHCVFYDNVDDVF